MELQHGHTQLISVTKMGSACSRGGASRRDDRVWAGREPSQKERRIVLHRKERALDVESGALWT